MNNAIAFPFLTLTDEAVNLSKWKIKCDDIEVRDLSTLPELLITSSKVSLYRACEINFDKADHDLDFKHGSFNISVKVGIGSSGSPMILKIQNFSVSRYETSELLIDIPAAEISQSIIIDTSITTADDINGCENSIYPCFMGSKIWSDTYRFSTELLDPLFPIIETDFTKDAVLNELVGVPWLIDWKPFDWHRDMTGAIRLLLNSKDKKFIRRFKKGDEHIYQMVMSDVISQVCKSFVIADVYVEEDQFAPGTLGAQAKVWCDDVFGDIGVTKIKAIALDSPNRFQAMCMKRATFEANEEGVADE